MTKRKVIIDCDPGIDDAFAIALALKAKELDVLAIHTVAGNVSVHHTTRNTRGLVKLLGSQVEICMGAEAPLCAKQVLAADIHGNNGFSGHQFADEELAELSADSALESYRKKLSASEEPIDIIAVGPLTNLGVLLTAYPHLKPKIGTISIMGGGIKGGNITAAGEFNFYADPEAAQIVFQSGINLIMAGLDVTEKARLYQTEIDQIEQTCGSIGTLLAKLVIPSLNRSLERLGTKSTAPNDACAVLVLIEEHLFQGQFLKVEIETGGHLTKGMSIADQRSHNREPGNALVLFEVDNQRFQTIVCERLASETVN